MRQPKQLEQLSTAEDYRHLFHTSVAIAMHDVNFWPHAWRGLLRPVGLRTRSARIFPRI